MNAKKLEKRMAKARELAPIARALAENKAAKEGVSIEQVTVIGTKKGKMVAVVL